MDWIDVNDKLPEDEGFVVIKCDDGIITGSFSKEFNEKGDWTGICCCIHEVDYPNEVTHWMPLPEPPKD